MEYTKFIDNEKKFIYFDVCTKTKPMMPSEHYHDVFEIYYLTKGNCRYFIDDKTYETKAGDLILIPKGVIHKTTYGEGERQRKLINCSYHYIPTNVIPKLPLLMYHYRNSEISKEIDDIFLNIEKEYIKNDEFSHEALLNYIHLLFYLIARNENQTEKTDNGNYLVTEVISYLKENYDKPISLTEIADNLSVSIEHLSRVFKKETGLAFVKYLNMLRFQKAEELLKNNDNLPITEIAYKCGFNDSNYFSDKFKKYYGISPLKFKKSGK